MGLNPNPGRFSDTNEIFVTETERERNVLARITKTGIAAPVGLLLIDKSDAGGIGAAGFQHDKTGRIDISAIKVTVDRDASATGAIKVGVITAISAASADITWFFVLNFANASDRFLVISEIYTPSQVKCAVSGGRTTRIVSNDKDTGNTRFQNDTAIESSLGSNVIPAVGDVVVDCRHSAGTYAMTCMVLYHAEEDLT